MRHAGDDLDCQDFATVRTKSAKLRTEIFGCGDDIARLRNKTPGLSGDALPTCHLAEQPPKPLPHGLPRQRRDQFRLETGRNVTVEEG